MAHIFDAVMQGDETMNKEQALSELRWFEQPSKIVGLYSHDMEQVQLSLLQEAQRQCTHGGLSPSGWCRYTASKSSWRYGLHLAARYGHLSVSSYIAVFEEDDSVAR